MVAFSLSVLLVGIVFLFTYVVYKIQQLYNLNRKKKSTKKYSFKEKEDTKTGIK